MSFKVLIADDDILIRKGLKSMIKWEEFDCVVCAEAQNGEEGLKLALNLKPDIIITDIKMPNMDGIEMVGMIKEELPDSIIIIITAYREFEYAQEAIKVGAFDFILKPTRVDDLINVIKKACRELSLKKNREKEFIKFKELFMKNIPILRERFLFGILNGFISEDENSISQCKLFELSSRNYYFILVNLDEKNIQKPYNHAFYLFGISNTFEDLFSQTQCKIYPIQLGNNQIGFVINVPDYCVECEKEIVDRCTYFSNMIKNCFDIDITIAISSFSENIFSLDRKFHECKLALNYKFYYDKESIIFYNDLSHLFLADTKINIENIKKELLDAVKTGNIDRTRHLLMEFFDMIKYTKLEVAQIRNICFSVINEVSGILNQLSEYQDINPLDLINIFNKIEIAENITTLYTIIDEAITYVAKLINDYNSRSINILIRKAVDFINNHYAQDISLKDVADNLYISSSYLSRLFKKELNINFIDYLNEMRIKKAKELIKSGKYKSYEVAEMVGIPDPHYFSKLFKKFTGYSPSEFKK